MIQCQKPSLAPGSAYQSRLTAVRQKHYHCRNYKALCGRSLNRAIVTQSTKLPFQFKPQCWKWRVILRTPLSLRYSSFSPSHWFITGVLTFPFSSLKSQQHRTSDSSLQMSSVPVISHQCVARGRSRRYCVASVPRPCPARTWTCRTWPWCRRRGPGTSGGSGWAAGWCWGYAGSDPASGTECTPSTCRGAVS